MSDYQPQLRDRVNLTGTVDSVHSSIGAADGLQRMVVAVALDGDDRTTAFVSVGSATLTLIERPPPQEEWQPGDVVRNADDPEDVRVWMHSPLYGHNESWLWHRHEADGFTASAIRYSREDLPHNLLLLVRDGHPVTQPQPEPVHPQPGDVVTEEPPVGSVVKSESGTDHRRDVAGWLIDHSSDDDPYSWGRMVKCFAPLTLVRWGAGQ